MHDLTRYEPCRHVADTNFVHLRFVPCKITSSLARKRPGSRLGRSETSLVLVRCGAHAALLYLPLYLPARFVVPYSYLRRERTLAFSRLYVGNSLCEALCGPWPFTQCRLVVSHRRWPSCPHMSHVSSLIQSLALCPNCLRLKYDTAVRLSSNQNAVILPPPNVTLSDYSSFSASSLVATLITSDACYPLGLGCPSHLIVHTSTPFSVPNRSTADLLIFPVSVSIASDTSI